MPKTLSSRLAAAGIALTLIAGGVGAALAQAQQVGPETNLPLPRFVSLRSGEVNVRVGPGANFPVDWTYVRLGLPVEIFQEFDNWRRIRDSEGNSGWVLWNLLSGDRYALVLDRGDGAPLEVRSSPQESANVVARLEPGVIAAIDRCQIDWCRLSDDRFSGWVAKSGIWGAYPDEAFD